MTPSPKTGMGRPARRIGACWVVAVLASACTAVPDEAPPANDTGGFDAAFDAVMTRYSLPGLALGIVRDGEVVYARTAGELVAGSGKPVTRDTLFKIASNTKAMTTGVLARLVDAGKLRWDDPVTRYLPSFRMHDAWVTREMQVRDLLIHNSGLREGAGDLMLWPEPNHFTRADVLAGLAYLKPVHSFRSHYDYDNLLYIVAGEVAAAAAGQPYEDLLRKELFGPLGMTRCHVGEWRRDAVGNVAQPHVKQDDGYQAGAVDGEIVPAVTMAAAGGVRCSLNDMLRWVRMWLDPADAWLTPARRDELWAAQMPRPTSERERRWNGTNFSAYGYGWRLSDVDGKLRVAHTGTLSGMYSAVTLLPGSATGFVFLINGDAADARVALNQALVKLLVSGAGAPTVSDYADEIERERAAGRDASAGGAPPPAASDRRPARAAEFAAMLGIYRDPWFGEAALCERAGGVSFRSVKSPKLTGDVVRVGPRLLVDWDDASVDTEAWLDFRPATGTSDVATLTLAKVDPEADFSYDYEDLEFSRIRDCPMNDDIDVLMRPYDGEVPGAAVLVVRNGEPVVRRGYGLADLERDVPVTPATNFRLASVTKQFTAAAILLLAEDRRLGLDDPARKWLPHAAGGGQRGNDPPVADAHLGTRRLRGRHTGVDDRAAPRCRRAGIAREPAPHVFSAGHGVSLQQQRLCPSRARRRARIRRVIRGISPAADLPAARHGGHRGAAGRNFHGRLPRVRLQRRKRVLGAHGPEPDERGARRRRDLFVDRRPGEMGCRAR